MTFGGAVLSLPSSMPALRNVSRAIVNADLLSMEDGEFVIASIRDTSLSIAFHADSLSSNSLHRPLLKPTPKRPLITIPPSGPSIFASAVNRVTWSDVMGAASPRLQRSFRKLACVNIRLNAHSRNTRVLAGTYPRFAASADRARAKLRGTACSNAKRCASLVCARTSTGKAIQQNKHAPINNSGKRVIEPKSFVAVNNQMVDRGLV